MERINKINHKSKEIIFIDYSGIKTETEMIAVIKAHKELVLRENKKSLFLADYTNSYTLSGYVKEAKTFVNETKHLTIKGAFLGLTGAKNILLSGVSKVFGMNFKSFNDKNKALDYLVE